MSLALVADAAVLGSTPDPSHDPNAQYDVAGNKIEVDAMGHPVKPESQKQADNQKQASTNTPSNGQPAQDANDQTIGHSRANPYNRVQIENAAAQLIMSDPASEKAPTEVVQRLELALREDLADGKSIGTGKLGRDTAQLAAALGTSLGKFGLTSDDTPHVDRVSPDRVTAETRGAFDNIQQQKATETAMMRDSLPPLSSNG